MSALPSPGSTVERAAYFASAADRARDEQQREHGRGGAEHDRGPDDRRHQGEDHADTGGPPGKVRNGLSEPPDESGRLDHRLREGGDPGQTDDRDHDTRESLTPGA